MSLDQLEAAVAGLPPDDLARFREWFSEFDAQVWDAQFERDAKSGQLDGLAESAVRSHQSGKSREL